ncbi:hypothetical protein Tco_0411984, partial [Tanacetum coccineum]
GCHRTKHPYGGAAVAAVGMAWWYGSDGCRGDDDDDMMVTMVEGDEDGDGIRLRVAMM